MLVGPHCCLLVSYHHPILACRNSAVGIKAISYAIPEVPTPLASSEASVIAPHQHKCRRVKWARTRRSAEERAQGADHSH